MSLSLDENWDIYGDEDGNLAVNTDPHDILQNVATACNMFKGENIYDIEQGIPFDNGEILDAKNIRMLAILLENESNRVQGVKDTQCYMSLDKNKRELSGVISVKLLNNEVKTVVFSKSK